MGKQSEVVVDFVQGYTTVLGAGVVAFTGSGSSVSVVPEPFKCLEPHHDFQNFTTFTTFTTSRLHGLMICNLEGDDKGG
jgi:hypothetical protein